VRLRPLTADEAERARWHVEAYGWCQRLADGVVSEEQVRQAVAECPEMFRDGFRQWLNHYRRQFKTRREWLKKSGTRADINGGLERGRSG